MRSHWRISRRPVVDLHLADRPLYDQMPAGVLAIAQPERNQTILIQPPGEFSEIDLEDLLSHEELHHILDRIGEPEASSDLDNYDPASRALARHLTHHGGI